MNIWGGVEVIGGMEGWGRSEMQSECGNTAEGVAVEFVIIKKWSKVFRCWVRWRCCADKSCGGGM